MTKRTEMLIFFSEMSFVQKEHSILLSVNDALLLLLLLLSVYEYDPNKAFNVVQLLDDLVLAY